MKKPLPPLSVHVVPEVLVPDFAVAHMINRFVGREPLPPFAPIAGVHEVGNTAEMRAEVKAGRLLPANEATALLCGVKWIEAKFAPEVESKPAKPAKSLST